MQPRPQARPVLPTPQTQLAMSAQAQAPRARLAVHVPNAYAPAAQQTQRDYPVVAQPVRPTYQEPVSARHLHAERLFELSLCCVRFHPSHCQIVPMPQHVFVQCYAAWPTANMWHHLMLLLHTMQVGRSLNQAATYLRDPYRGDDFERSNVGGMRSDVPKYGNGTQRDTRAYDSMLDDSLREDDYSGRAYSRNNRAYRR
jgi:hypothetical protein